MRAPVFLAAASWAAIDLVHPVGLAGQVEVVGPGRRAGRDQVVAIELIGPDRGDRSPWRGGPWRRARPGSSASATTSGRVRRRADLVADLGELLRRCGRPSPT